jgi:hypothetical protein
VRRLLQSIVVTVAVAITLVSVAWATVGVTPVGTGQFSDALTGSEAVGGVPGTQDGDVEAEPQQLEALIAAAEEDRRSNPRTDSPDRGLREGQVLVGTSVVDLAPRPPEGERWQTEDCATGLPNEETAGHRKTTTPDCIYMGGRGIGPAEPITHIDEDNPLEVRTVAIGDGDATAVLTQVDGVYWFGQYDSFCERCGAFDIAEDLGSELDLPASSFFIAASHAHNAPDFIGAWGGVPHWYMEQVGEAIRTSIREAVGSSEPALLQADEAFTRSLNVQRRDTYWSAEDTGFSWVRAVATNPSGNPTGRTLAVVGTFSAHPVTTGYEGGRAHGDWPGMFSQVVRAEEDSVGIAFVAGLGNMSTRQGTVATAEGLYGLLPHPSEASTLSQTSVATGQVRYDQPLSNLGLVALRAGMFFDRTTAGPAILETGKDERRQCRSTSAQSVETAVSAARIGPGLLIASGPGELFSNLTNTLKDQHPEATVLPLANVNDGLGYIMQSFEADEAGRQAVGFTDAPVEYEEAFSLDSCFGDAVLEAGLGLLSRLQADG